MSENVAAKKFRIFSEKVSKAAGSPVAFSAAVLLFVIWAATGPYFNWSEAHHTCLDIILSVTPFWMVFILQATQNRDSEIVEAKLDELLRAVADAREDLVGIHKRPEEEIEQHV